jgi:broad specificity phosphatase PhoE
MARCIRSRFSILIQNDGGREIVDLSEYGSETVALVESILGRGVDHAVVLMRHSAREYAPDRHDLENPLTTEGRDHARALGERLPKHLTLRAYASPPHRCMETAEMILAGHEALGGRVTRHRPLEALGVFYSLDQMKMWKGMREAGGLVPYLEAWFDGAVPVDAMMDPDVASQAIVNVMAEKLANPVAEAQLDVCVSHDMTLYLVRSRLLGQPLSGREVRYLDGLILFTEDGDLRLAAPDGEEVTVFPGRD